MTNMDARQRPLKTGSSRGLSAAKASVCGWFLSQFGPQLGPQFCEYRRPDAPPYVDCGC